MDAAEEVGQAVAFPRPGETFEPAEKLPADAWWREVSQPMAHSWRRPKPVQFPGEASERDLDLADDR
ncbi:hypothetical protein [Streptomyces sp. NPDC058758]|uniref:hypothetical protein n=1 Tax=Streptomyces sp. NPDC058758 TaxID=3346627 RepID=UPI0036BB07E4